MQTKLAAVPLPFIESSWRSKVAVLRAVDSRGNLYGAGFTGCNTRLRPMRTRPAGGWSRRAEEAAHGEVNTACERN